MPTSFQIQHINNSVLFLKEKDVILTNDHWRVAIDLDTSKYEDVISSIRSDLMVVSKQQKEFTPISELKQIEILLNILESRLLNFQQLLPKLDSRRGILNFGGTILQKLFGIATVSDPHMLHEKLDELKSKDVDIEHSLANQVTYVKSLDHKVRVNADAILSLSTILKNKMIQSHDNCQQIIRDIAWLNMTIYNHSVLFLVIRHIEFALLQLTHQVDEILVAVQHILLGKLPITIVNPKCCTIYYVTYPFVCRKIMN